MDGLLIDSERIWFDTLLDLGRDRNDPRLNAELGMQLVGLPWQSVAQAFLHLLDNEDAVMELRADWQQRYLAKAAEVTLKPGVRGLLDRLDQLSIPFAIATGSQRATAVKHLTAHGLLERFVGLVTAEDYQKGKPDPEPFRMASDLLGREPQDCLALEDSINGIRSAHAAGMPVICIPDMVAPPEEVAALCMAVEDSLENVSLRLAVFA